MECQPSEIEIRMISGVDLEKNRNILIELLNENNEINFPDRSDLEKFAINNYQDMVRFNKDNSAILVGAYLNGTIVGFIWAYRRDFFGEKRIHITHIVVDSKIRGRGVGTKLMDTLEKLSIQEEIFKIDLMTTFTNENAMNFYKAKDFSIARVQLEKKLFG